MGEAGKLKSQNIRKNGKKCYVEKAIITGKNIEKCYLQSY